MDLCSIPSYWPLTRSLLALIFMTIGAVLLLIWMTYISQYVGKKPIILRPGTLLRSFIKINHQRWAMAIIFCLIAVGFAFIKTQITSYDPCFVLPDTFDPSLFFPWFLALYILAGVMHSQGLGCHVEENIKVSWDRGDILSLHLAGRPHDVLKVLRGDMAEKVHYYAKQFEAAALPSTVRLESWLFVRHVSAQSKSELQTLYALLDFPKLTNVIEKTKAKPRRFWRVLFMRLLRLALLTRLVVRLGRIDKTLLIMTMPEFPKVTCTACGAPTTSTISKAIERLQLLDPSRRFGVLPIRKFTAWEVIHLVTNYPALSSQLVPWTTGFQFTK